MPLAFTNCGVKGCLDVLVVERKFGSAKLAVATRGAFTLAVFSAVLLIAFQTAHAQTETVLYSFTNSPDGAYPYAGLIKDKKGNLYGTTHDGGAYGYGTVFELTAAGTEKVLYSFGSQTGDGAYPYAGLLFDKKGNLYGTTRDGGTYGIGTVFEVTPSGTQKVLYSFGSQSGDGANPYAGLITDKEGNLYGTTRYGGTYGNGTAFKLTPSETETILYSFGSQSGDGANPCAGLITDKEGNLYGTTRFGGAYGSGTTFKLTPSGTETLLYSFGSQSGDGANPYAGLIMDKKGNLYGTTISGGAYGYGTVFELSSTGKETVLYSTTNGDNDGGNIDAGLVLGKKGNLYGASANGPGSNYGVAFELSPGKNGAPWTFTTLHAFNDSGSGDGLDPFGTLIPDTSGNLYGTTSFGGAYGYGTVFKVTP